MPKDSFLPAEFTPTKFSTASDKVEFGNHFLRFIESKWAQTLFTKDFYHRLPDVGLITMRNEKKLAKAGMIKDSPASEEVRERVIAQITKAVWSEADRNWPFCLAQWETRKS
jgi:hypothetical protein